jgi:hypothetical protein
MEIGQRVHTKFGAGTVAGFERITHVITHHDTYQEGDRIEVKLDDPTQWAIRNGGNPYFYAKELTQLTKE